MIEVLMQVREDKYKDNPILAEGLDLVVIIRLHPSTDAWNPLILYPFALFGHPPSLFPFWPIRRQGRQRCSQPHRFLPTR